MATGLKDRFHTVQAFFANRGELWPTVIDGRVIHCPQHPVRYIGWARNLQKMTPNGMRCRHKNYLPTVS